MASLKLVEDRIFFILALFEFTREIAVLASDPEPKIAILAYVGSTHGYTSAKGRWIRINGGGKIVPGATSITCNETEGRCIEATASVFNGYVSEPTIDAFNATFGPDAIVYKNDDPRCARYDVRIDLRLKKVFAVRERKSNPKNEMCQKLEQRIEMTLDDGYQRNDEPLGDHFVPVIRLFGWLFR